METIGLLANGHTDNYCKGLRDKLEYTDEESIGLVYTKMCVCVCVSVRQAVCDRMLHVHTSLVLRNLRSDARKLSEAIMKQHDDVVQFVSCLQSHLIPARASLVVPALDARACRRLAV